MNTCDFRVQGGPDQVVLAAGTQGTALRGGGRGLSGRLAAPANAMPGRAARRAALGPRRRPLEAVARPRRGIQTLFHSFPFLCCYDV